MRRVFLIAVVAGVAYVLLWQVRLYGVEVALLDQVTAGARPKWRFAPYVAVLTGLAHLPGAQLFGLHRYACWLNAVAVALGLLAFAAVMRRRLPAHQAWLGVALLASCPAIIFHATSPQPHALAFALVSAATWLVMRAAMTNSTSLAVAGAAGLGPAYLFDPTAVVALAWWLPTLAPRMRRGRVAVLLVAAVASVALAHVTAFGWAPARWPSWVGNPEKIDPHALSIDNLGVVAGAHALRPFLPLSLAVVAGLWCDASRRWACHTVVAASFYVLVQAGLDPLRATEGASMLPLAIPAVLTTVRWLTPRAQIVAVGLGIALGVAKLAVHHDADAKAFAVATRAFADASKTVLLVSSDGADRPASIMCLPDYQHVCLASICLQTGAAHIPSLVHPYLAQRFAEGQRVYLTSEAEAQLRSSHVRKQYPAAAALLELLQRDYTLVQVEHERFRAKEVRPRTGR